MASGYLDYAAKAAYAARVLNTIKDTQVSQLIEILESSPEDKAIEYTIAFVARQVARGPINEAVGRIIIETLLDIKNKHKEEARDIAREFLGIFKWLYEASEKIDIEKLRKLDYEQINFDRFIKFLIETFQ